MSPSAYSGGISGYSGTSGTSGTGTSGTSGTSGTGGTSGTSGTSGAKPAGKIFLSAAGMWPSQTTGCSAPAQLEMSTSKQSVYYLAFADGSTTYAQTTVAMPSDWDAGTVTAVFYWTHPTGSGDVVWSCQATSYGDGNAIDATWGTAVNVTDTGGTASTLYISNATSAITIAGAAASELVQFRVSRVGGDGADTMAVAAYLLGVMITFTRSA